MARIEGIDPRQTSFLMRRKRPDRIRLCAGMAERDPTRTRQESLPRRHICSLCDQGLDFALDKHVKAEEHGSALVCFDQSNGFSFPGIINDAAFLCKLTDPDLTSARIN